MKRGRHTVGLTPLTEAAVSHHLTTGKSLLSTPPGQQVISCPPSHPLHFDSVEWIFPCHFTLTCYDQTSHAVWDAGASSQEGDAHDDIWDPQCETDHSYLKWRKTDTLFYCSLPPGDTHNDPLASLQMLHSNEHVSKQLACFCQGVKCA